MAARSGIENAMLSMLAPMLARIGSDPNVHSTIDTVVREWREMRSAIADMRAAVAEMRATISGFEHEDRNAANGGTGSVVRSLGYSGNGSEAATPDLDRGKSLS